MTRVWGVPRSRCSCHRGCGKWLAHHRVFLGHWGPFLTWGSLHCPQRLYLQVLLILRSPKKEMGGGMATPAGSGSNCPLKGPTCPELCALRVLRAAVSQQFLRGQRGSVQVHAEQGPCSLSLFAFWRPGPALEPRASLEAPPQLHPHLLPALSSLPREQPGEPPASREPRARPPELPMAR